MQPVAPGTRFALLMVSPAAFRGMGGDRGHGWEVASIMIQKKREGVNGAKGRENGGRQNAQGAMK